MRRPRAGLDPRTRELEAIQALARAARSGGLDLVVVDHTGLIDPGPGRQHHLTAAREGWPVLGLATKAATLEDVFLQLVREEVAHG